MGKKTKKKVQWRKLSLNELQSIEASSKRRPRRTPDRDVKEDDCGDWNSPAASRPPTGTAIHTGTNKRGPQLQQQQQQPYPGPGGDVTATGHPAGDGRYHRTHDDDFTNYANHHHHPHQHHHHGVNNINSMNHRYNNFHEKRFHYNGGGPHHVDQHDGYDMNYHVGYSNRNNMNRPFKNFDRDRPRFYNNGYPPPTPPPMERFSRGDGSHNGFYQNDRRRPPYRVNGRPAGYINGNSSNNFGGSPSLRRRFSNGDEPPFHFHQQRNGQYHNGNSSNPRYGGDGSNCGNGHDSGGSNGYEGGSSETQSEPEERHPQHQPVQSILIDNDQYTKIQTPRQEVIFKKNSSSGAGSATSPSRSQEEVVDDRVSNPKPDGAAGKRNNTSNNVTSRNKRNRTTDAGSAANTKQDTTKKASANTSSVKRQDTTRKAEAAKKGTQSDASRARAGKDTTTAGSDKEGSGGKTTGKKQSGRSSDRGENSVKQDTDDTQSDDQRPREDDEEDEYCAESDYDEEEEVYAQDDYPYMQDMQDESEGGFSGTNPEAPPLAGVIMQQCYPGGPMVSIPVHWTPFLDPSLIPGDTALTPLDPAFTHLLDPSFQPLDPMHWENSEGEGGPPSIYPESVIPVQHDASGCPVTVQVKVDENGVPIQIEPSSFTVQLSSLQQPPYQQQHPQHHHPSCQMAGLDMGMPLHYGPPYADDNHRNQYFEYNFDEGLEKRLEQKIDEELARHYSDEEEDEEKGRSGEDGQQDEKLRDSRDCEETSCDSQYASMSEGSSLPTSPAGELSDSPSTCPPNTPSSTDTNDTSSTPKILEASATPTRDASPSNLSSTPGTSSGSSSISISSASTLCASSSSSSSTLVSLSSSPVNSGNPSKETSPSSLRQPLAQRTSSLSSSTSGDTDPASDESDAAGAAARPAPLSVADAAADPARFNVADGDADTAALNVADAADTAADPAPSNVTTSTKVDVDAENIGDIEKDAKVETPIVEGGESSEERNLSAESSARTTEANDGNEEKMQVVGEQADTTRTGDQGTMINADTAVNTASSNTEEAVEGTAETTDDGLEGATVDENGMTVTVKSGYVMVPILTPYYDPSVLYGYSMMNDAPMDRSYSSTSKKKKKKHNRRRAMENNPGGYMDTEMYAGEPYVATPDGYLLPMDASQMCHFQHPGAMQYAHPMHQYQYQMMHGMAHQYHPNSDEGFVSVEHTPHLPDHLPEPLSDGRHEDCSKFGALHETERQQIQEVLLDAKPAALEEVVGAELSDSGVSETEEVAPVVSVTSSSVSEPCKEEIPQALDLSSSNTDSTVSICTSESQTIGDVSSEDTSASNGSCASEQSLKTMVECDQSSEVVNNSEADCKLLELASEEADSASDNEFDDIVIEPLCSSIAEIKVECPVESVNVCEDKVEENSQTTHSVKDIISISTALNRPDKQENDVCLQNNDAAKIEDEDVSNENSKISGITSQIILRTDQSTSDSDPCDESCDLNTLPSAETETLDKCDKNSLDGSVDSINHEPESIVKQSSNSSVYSSQDEIEGESDEVVSKLREEMQLAQSLLDARISNESTRASTACEDRVGDSTMKDLRVTEAVKRWIREVTPDKVFALTDEAQTMIMDHRIEEASEDEDEYFEDNVVEPGGRGGGTLRDGKSNLPKNAHSTGTAINSDESSKNVRGNPFGALCNDSSCVVKSTKRVASFSGSDVLDDYDGCSTVSSLSHGALFSPTNSQVISQSSSRTITPNRGMEGVDEDLKFKAISCDPSGCRKYYQLAVEVDDSPAQTVCQQSPLSPASPDCSGEPSTSSVLPLAAEILKAGQNFGPRHHNCSSNCLASPSHCGSPSSLTHSPVYCSSCSNASKASLSSPCSPTSAFSSGLGSSLATTPTSSPQHLHRSAHSSPRLPFFFIPANMRVESSGSVPLNTVHCCSLM